MFRGLINDAKSAVSSVIIKYVARASVAVPFIIALGFAIAAGTMMLIERYGPIAGNWIVAGGFLTLGIIAAIVVAIRERGEEKADKQAEQADTSSVATDAAEQAAVQAPLALLGALFSTPLAPTASLKAIKVLGRNLPLVVLLVLVGMLFWPRSAQEAALSEEEAVSPRPNGAHPPFPEHPYRV